MKLKSFHCDQISFIISVLNKPTAPPEYISEKNYENVSSLEEKPPFVDHDDDDNLQRYNNDNDNGIGSLPNCFSNINRI